MLSDSDFDDAGMAYFADCQRNGHDCALSYSSSASDEDHYASGVLELFHSYPQVTWMVRASQGTSTPFADPPPEIGIALEGWLSQNPDRLVLLPVGSQVFAVREFLAHGLLSHPFEQGFRPLSMEEQLLAQLCGDQLLSRSTALSWGFRTPFDRFDVFVRELITRLHPPQMVESILNPPSLTPQVPLPTPMPIEDPSTPTLSTTSHSASSPEIVTPSDSPPSAPFYPPTGQASSSSGPSAPPTTDPRQERIAQLWRKVDGKITCIWSGYFGGDCTRTFPNPQNAARHLATHIPDLNGKALKTMCCTGKCNNKKCRGRPFNRASSLARHVGVPEKAIGEEQVRLKLKGRDASKVYARDTEYAKLARPWCESSSWLYFKDSPDRSIRRCLQTGRGSFLMGTGP